MALYKSTSQTTLPSLKLTNTNTAEYNLNANPAMVLGDGSGLHLELSPNRVLSKASSTTGSELYLNYGTGKDVYMTDIWPTREIKELKSVLQSMSKSLVTNYSFALGNFAKLYEDQSTITVSISSSSITSTQSSSHRCASFVGNVYVSYDMTLYKYMRITGYHNGTTYGGPSLTIIFSDSESQLRTDGSTAVSTGLVSSMTYKQFTFNSTSSSTHDIDISDIVGTKFIGLYNVFTKYTITGIQLIN